MYCKNCGNSIDDNAKFCNRCGAPVQNQSFATPTPGMDKKEYFDSSYASEGSKKMRTASKILIGILAAVIAFMVLTNIKGVRLFTTVLNSQDITLAELIEKLEALGMDDFEINDENIDSVEFFSNLQTLEEEYEKEFGISLIELIKTTFYITVAITIGGSVLMLLFAVLGVLKFKKGFAITALVFSILFSGSWVCICITIALLVLVNKLNNEYNAYCMNGTIPNNIINEPYFGA